MFDSSLLPLTEDSKDSQKVVHVAMSPLKGHRMSFGSFTFSTGTGVRPGSSVSVDARVLNALTHLSILIIAV